PLSFSGRDVRVHAQSDSLDLFSRPLTAHHLFSPPPSSRGRSPSQFSPVLRSGLSPPKLRLTRLTRSHPTSFFLAAGHQRPLDAWWSRHADDAVRDAAPVCAVRPSRATTGRASPSTVRSDHCPRIQRYKCR